MSNETDKDVAFIQALAEILRNSDLSEIEIEREYGEDNELKVRLARGSVQAIVAPSAAPAPHVSPAAASAPVTATQPVEPAVATESGPDLTNAVTSPMVGTAYLSSEPGAAPFVTEGDTVEEGQTILIIEAMKTMNQIPSPRAGRVRAVLVENAEPVEFGEPLMVIE